MKINWFPGHMAKSVNDLVKKAVLVDLFILVLDARAPISSFNSEFQKIAPNKFRLLIITKIDLADQKKLVKTKKFFEKKNFFVLLINLKDNGAKRQILAKLNHLNRLKQEKNHKDFQNAIMKIFVVGMPNTGKSTLINLLTNSQLKVGNQPGITRNNQWVSLNNFLFLDTPGILLPKMEDELVAIKLALIGSIKQEIIDLNYLVVNSYILISDLYPNLLIDLGINPAKIESEINFNLIKLAQIKGFRNKNDLGLNRCRIWFLNYIRQQKITLD